MIKVKRPNGLSNSDQECVLTLKTNPVSRRWLELRFSYENALEHYREQFHKYPPTEHDFEEWLEGLPTAEAKDLAEKGFLKCYHIFSFRRHVCEKHDFGLNAYVRELMGPEEHAEYMAMPESYRRNSLIA